MSDCIDRETFTKTFEDHNAKCCEILKCRNDITYFIEHYVTLPNGGKIVLKDWQKEYLKHLVDGNDAILSDKQQSGKTTINVIYVIWSANFHPQSRCTFITCVQQISHALKIMIDILNLLPRWLCSALGDDIHMKHICFSNGSIIVITSANGVFCGYWPGRTLVLDDVELYPKNNFDNVYYGLVPVLKSYRNSQLIMTYSSGSNTCRISELIMNAAIRGQLFFGEIK